MSSLRIIVTALCCVLVVVGVLPFSSDAQLDPSFYSYTCPNVHSIVHKVIKKVSKSDARMLASLVRLHFHDCFVQVCIYTCSFIVTLKFGVKFPQKKKTTKNK